MRWTTVSTAEMAIIADRRIVRRERFLANVTTRRDTVHLPLLFRQRFYEHVGGYNIFYTPNLGIVTLYSLHRDGNMTITCRTNIAYSTLY